MYIVDLVQSSPDGMEHRTVDSTNSQVIKQHRESHCRRNLTRVFRAVQYSDARTMLWTPLLSPSTTHLFAALLDDVLVPVSA